ncbi:GPP34 family phosphoprotein [Amycolatopsis sp. 195334CR]|uniref:GOLPH3/VPS74 family protein n=1 Tax=Amycolatopsis sp. 195334CR TaxID=2814588 RepID=UPI001A8F518E|nr:GPP34 family phosphoprotein [Amycolatopsis sp. 195334CR]MBN6036562.1 GPP34 family phosphoprotein [Amycolatopsis sp. 195334CR]
MNPTLPQRLYLLVFRPEENKLDSASALVRGQLVRAGAVAELRLTGLLHDHGGKAVPNPATPPPRDPFLAEVFHDAPRTWFNLVDRNWHKAERTVRDQLEAAGAVTVGKGRALGLFPTREPSLAEPRRVGALREQVRNAVLLGHDPAGVPVADAVMAVLTADCDVRSVFTPKERRAHKPALTALRNHVDAVLPGLRKATELSIAARRAGAA